MPRRLKSILRNIVKYVSNIPEKREATVRQTLAAFITRLQHICKRKSGAKANIRLQSQSARSENQQRPASQGFHGREAGSSGSGANPASGGNFDAPQSTNNNLLGNQPAEGGEHDPTGGFGALYETGLPGVQNGSAGSGGY